MAELTIDNIRRMAEDVELEAKRATGRDGAGALPDSVRQTYSAMANTEGGVILLGIEEKPKGTFVPVGIADVARVKKELWDVLNDRNRVSVNLLSDSDVEAVMVGGKQVIRIKVPRAQRRQRPVFIGQNPLTGTYRRCHESDYKCDEETVRRLLAEQVEEARDARILPGFTFEDLDLDAFVAYRNQFKITRPDHPWNDQDNPEFLRSIGGWGRGRENGQEGMTLAGLLMFGKLRPILDAVPNYVVDYQERPEAEAELRWTDRITTDGTWSGNLYDFYRRVIRKLTTDLKVPFKLKKGQREDDTPVHEALREALVNALIHADYTGRLPVLVIKRPDMFSFRNPGTMRVAIEAAVRGGVSDCRNRNLQKMFQLVGLGEQAGSGLPKIYSNWESQHWRAPSLNESFDPEQTTLGLPMASLLPKEVVQDLDKRFGERFRALPKTERLALATAALEGVVTHSRLRAITSTHASDLTKLLSSLVRDGFLESDGTGRGTSYHLSGRKAPEPAVLFGDQASPEPAALVAGAAPDSAHKSSEHKAFSSAHKTLNSEHKALSEAEIAQLMKATEDTRSRKRMSPQELESKLLEICAGRFLPIKLLAELLGRTHDTLRVHYLNPMVKKGLLEQRFPNAPSHPHQSYRTAKQGPKA